MIWRHGCYWLTDEAERIDREAVLALLVRTYWASGRTRAQLDATIEHSSPFALFHGETPIGFARAPSDRGSCTYLMDRAPSAPTRAICADSPRWPESRACAARSW